MKEKQIYKWQHNKASSLISNMIFKIVVIGEAGVGKTSIINRYVDNRYEEKYAPTLGFDFKTKRLNVKNY